MVLCSWIQNLQTSFSFAIRSNSRLRRIRQAVEALETRLLPASLMAPTVFTMNGVGSTSDAASTENVAAPSDSSVTGHPSLTANAISRFGTGSISFMSTIAVNQPPVVSGIETTLLPYKANDPAFPPLPISSTVAITDPDSNNLNSVTIQITSGYENDVNGHDVLAFVPQYGITGAFDAISGTLTLSGSAYVGSYREALRTVTFSSSGSNVSDATRTLTIIATDDGLPASAVSQPVTRTVSVLTTNLPPTLQGVPMAPLPYVQGTAALPVAQAATVIDPDSINLSSATVQVSGNYQQGLDLLAAVTAGTGISQSFDAVSGTLVLSGIDSLANYQMVLRTVTYRTTSIQGSTALRTLTFVLDDGVAKSSQVTRGVRVIPFNFSPNVIGMESTPLAYKVNDPAFPPLPISSTVNVTDPDSNNLTQMTIQITSGYQNDVNGHDSLNFESKYGITGTFDAGSGTLTLSGTSYVGYYREALRTVTFYSAGLNVSSANRTLTIIATDDGSPNAGISQPVTRTVTVLTTNVAPSLTGIPASPLSYIQGTAPIVVASSVSIIDPDSFNMGGATIQVAVNYQIGKDLLQAITAGTAITQRFDPSTGTLNLTGTDSLLNYQSVLRSVTFSTNSTTGSTLTRTLTFIVSDSVADSTKVARNVNMIAFNNPPAVSGLENLPLAYKANDPSASISNTVAITDADSNNLTKLTVQITSGYQNDSNGTDVLAFSNKYGISGSFDSITGTLTLSGQAYVGYYREALRSVTFGSVGRNVSTAPRILTIIATDDGSPNAGVSQPVTRTVSVTT